jgi:hypothetical protein
MSIVPAGEHAQSGSRVSAAARLLGLLTSTDAELSNAANDCVKESASDMNHLTLIKMAQACTKEQKSILIRRLQLIIEKETLQKVATDDDTEAWRIATSQLRGVKIMGTTTNLSMLINTIAVQESSFTSWGDYLAALGRDLRSQPDDTTLIQQVQMVAFIAAHPEPGAALVHLRKVLDVKVQRTTPYDLRLLEAKSDLIIELPTPMTVSTTDPELAKVLRQVMNPATASDDDDDEDYAPSQSSDDTSASKSLTATADMSNSSTPEAEPTSIPVAKKRRAAPQEEDKVSQAQ